MSIFKTKEDRRRDAEMESRVARMELLDSEFTKTIVAMKAMLDDMNGKLDEILAGQKAATPVAEPEEGPTEVDDGSQHTLERLARDVDDIKMLVARLCDTSAATDVKVITDVCDLLREIRGELKGRPAAPPITIPTPNPVPPYYPTWDGTNTSQQIERGSITQSAVDTPERIKITSEDIAKSMEINGITEIEAVNKEE